MLRTLLKAVLLVLALGRAAVPADDGDLRTIAGTGTAGYAGDGGPATEARLDQPFHVSFAPDGEMLIADTNNHCIRRVDGAGRIRTVAGCGRKGYSGDGGRATAATLNEPYGVVADRDGSLYVVDRLNACIRNVDPAGVITTLAGNGHPGYGGDGGPASRAQLREPNGLALDGRRNLYVADVADNRIRKIDLASGVITTASGTGRRAFAGDGGPASAASIDGARAVAVDREGNLYVCEREGNRIRKIDGRTGVIRTLAGTGTAGYSGDGGPALAATLRGPKWVDVDAQGAVFVVDTENHAVRRIDPATGVISTVAGSGQKGGGGDGGPPNRAQLDRPHGCATRQGRLYIADTNNHRVRIVLTAESQRR